MFSGKISLLSLIPCVVRSAVELKARGLGLIVSELSDDVLPIQAFKQQGTGCVVTDEPSTKCVELPEKFAIAFGNEHRGASQSLIRAADHTFCIPMYGFTESFNISVAVGCSLTYFLAQSRPQRLSDDETAVIYARWLLLKNPRAKTYLKMAGIELPTL